MLSLKREFEHFVIDDKYVLRHTDKLFEVSVLSVKTHMDIWLSFLLGKSESINLDAIEFNYNLS